MVSGIISGIVNTVGGIASEFIEDKDKRNEFTTRIQEALINSKDLNEKLRAGIIQAEVASKFWLAANWRPLLMLWFAGLIGAHWFGFTATNLTEAERVALLEIVKWGIAGYIPCRTAEKLIPSIMGAIANRKQS